MDNNIYPLTIVKDRYMGTYSGGDYTAWNCDADMVPTEIFDDDGTCLWFWDNIRDGDRASWIPKFGIGRTIEDAISDLQRRMNEK